MSDAVDLGRVLALDAAATPGPWRNVDDWHLSDDDDIHVVQAANYKVADLIAFYRTAAPAMARALQDLRELAENSLVASSGAITDLIRLRNVIFRVTAPPDETEGGEA